jgi:hypothetical protein
VGDNAFEERIRMSSREFSEVLLQDDQVVFVDVFWMVTETPIGYKVVSSNDAVEEEGCTAFFVLHRALL